MLWALSGGRQFPGAKELAGLCLARHNQLRSRSRSPGVAAARGAGERAARGREQGGGVHGGAFTLRERERERERGSVV